MAIATDAALERGPATAAPRLAPISRPWNPLYWLVAAVYRSIGAPLPARVIFARAPRLVLAHLLLVITSEYALSLDKRLRALARVFASRVNGCMFCDNLETRLAIASGSVARADVDALADYPTSSRFSERERAALAYLEEVNRSRQTSDATFAELRRHFTDREVVELTWLNAVGNYLNMQARPLGLAPDQACSIPAR